MRSELTKEAVKDICECKGSLAEKLGDRECVFQVVELTIMEGEKAAKVKARMHVSDGVSRMNCVVSAKVWELLVSISRQIISLPLTAT